MNSKIYKKIKNKKKIIIPRHPLSWPRAANIRWWWDLSPELVSSPLGPERNWHSELFSSSCVMVINFFLGYIGFCLKYDKYLSQWQGDEVFIILIWYTWDEEWNDQINMMINIRITNYIILNNLCCPQGTCYRDSCHTSTTAPWW